MAQNDIFFTENDHERKCSLFQQLSTLLLIVSAWVKIWVSGPINLWEGFVLYRQLLRWENEVSRAIYISKEKDLNRDHLGSWHILLHSMLLLKKGSLCQSQRIDHFAQKVLNNLFELHILQRMFVGSIIKDHFYADIWCHILCVLSIWFCGIKTGYLKNRQKYIQDF